MSSASNESTTHVAAPQVPLRALLAYFFRLGALGFGGPVVLTSHMRRDLVDDRGWIAPEEFENSLALAQLAPGPLAAQLAIFLGWVRYRVLGATLVGFAFILPSFIIVLGLSALYVQYSGLAWIQGAFYGIGATVIAIMAIGVHKLMRRTIGKDRLFWEMASHRHWSLDSPNVKTSGSFSRPGSLRCLSKCRTLATRLLPPFHLGL